jgi:hypothetical protein
VDASATKDLTRARLVQWKRHPGADGTQLQPPPKALFRMMGGIFGFFVLLGWTLGGLTAYAGWCIARRKRKAIVYIIAALNCVFVPYGTLLGVALVVVMFSATAQSEFERARTT